MPRNKEISFPTSWKQLLKFLEGSKPNFLQVFLLNEKEILTHIFVFLQKKASMASQKCLSVFPFVALCESE